MPLNYCNLFNVFHFGRSVGCSPWPVPWPGHGAAVPHAPRGSRCHADSAGKPAACDRRLGLGSCSRMMPFFVALKRSVSMFSAAARGVIRPSRGPQVGAEHHHAALLQGQSRRCLASSQNRDSGRTVSTAVVVATPLSAISTAAMPLSISSRGVSAATCTLRFCDATSCDGRRCGRRPRSCAPPPDSRRRACRSGRTWRARIARRARRGSSSSVGRRGPVVEGQHHLAILQVGRVSGKLLARRGAWSPASTVDDARGAQRIACADIRRPAA